MAFGWFEVLVRLPTITTVGPSRSWGTRRRLEGGHGDFRGAVEADGEAYGAYASVYVELGRAY